jgi:hypothetical protein
MNADQGLYDSLYHSAAVVGLNTSAMIEAGILAKPVLTIVSDEFSGGQDQTLHFHYLRASNGGLLHEARDLNEHVQQVAAALRGETGRERTLRFIERFVRPGGLATPVTPIMVEEIERAARIPKRARVRSPLWHHAARWVMRGALAGRRTFAVARPVSQRDR